MNPSPTTFVAIFETFEHPSAAYPNGSYLFRVGSRFIQATGRFAGLAEELDPEGFAMARLASIPRLMFVSFGNPTDLTWTAKSYCSALVKEAPKAMVLYQEPAQ